MKINSYFFERLKKEHYENVLIDLLPTKYFSNHVLSSNKIKKGNSIYLFIIAILYTHLYSINQLKRLIREKCFSLKKEYKLLVYLPNNKYQRFFKSLFKDDEIKSILIISDETIELEHITKNSFFESRVKTFFSTIYPSYLMVIKTLYKTYIIEKHNNFNRTSLLHLNTAILQTHFINSLSKKTSFKKFFSLHPNGDLHNILKELTNLETHSIRPDTTIYTEEHKFIKSDILYFKSDFEKEVYRHYKIKTELVKTGFIYNELQKKKTKYNEKLNVLFIDTCTNINKESVQIRHRSIIDYYEIFNSEMNLFHKFHPGLVKEEKDKTIEVFKKKSVEIVEEINDLSKFDVVIGFFSTMFHDCLCKGITYIELTGEYSVESGFITPIDKSPLNKIKNKSDLYETKIKLENDISLFYNDDIWNWYYQTYNIPDGKINLKTNLLN